VGPAAQPATLSWAEAAVPPTGQTLAVTATETGFLAASHTTEGAEFWTSDDGETWTLLGTGAEALGPDQHVFGLTNGPAGFVAQVSERADGSYEGTNAVWTSTDGANWHRSELIPELPEVPSPYVIQQSFVSTVLIGPNGFLAFGAGGLSPDLDLIAADFAPDYTAEDNYAVDAELRPDGAVLIVGFGDEEPLEIPFAELGVTPEELADIFEGEVEGSGFEFFMWSSTDGVSWEPLVESGLPEHVVPGFSAVSLGADDGFYLFAPGPDPQDPEAPGVMSGFHSTDGRAWTQFVLEGPTEAWMHYASFGEGLFIAVGEDELGQGMWTSPDARTWTRMPDAVFDVGAEDQFFSFFGVNVGGAGYGVSGMVWVEPPEDLEMPEPVISKDGYAVTLGDEGVLTVADQATGDVLAAIDPETGRSDNIEVSEDETGLTFVNIASGETLVVITHDEINAAFEALGEELGIGQPPVQVLRYSADMETWTLDTDEALFGDGKFSLTGAVGDEVVIAVVSSDRELWEMGEDPLDLPQAEIWVGTPTS
jgi:hypothetical protein